MCQRNGAVSGADVPGTPRYVTTNGQEGKEETFRCRYGSVYLYVEGEGDASAICGGLLHTDVTVFHEIKLNPGEQYTIMPNTRHWFRGGENGAVVSEFSTHSTDETDVFEDKHVARATQAEESNKYTVPKTTPAGRCFFACPEYSKNVRNTARFLSIFY